MPDDKPTPPAVEDGAEYLRKLEMDQWLRKRWLEGSWCTNSPESPGSVPIMRISDGTDVYLGTSAGGGHPDGEWSHLTLEFHKAGKVWLKHFTADELLRESHK